MMTKYTLLPALIGCLLSGAVLAEKVTYQKAVADSKAYQEALPNYENATTGLSSSESNSTATANQMGKWVKLSLIPLENAGVYSKMLTSNATGTSCIKGSKGIIPTMRKSTNRCKDKEDKKCDYYKSVTVATYENYSHGYKAECR
ncbi:hypothetical protein ACU5EH_23330 [Aliivibrio salmonicida]|uniref:hypothetical protein n=1 Tax=Aliivibrio salmonicida TaxID=40269 RepID=UPI00406CFB1B